MENLEEGFILFTDPRHPGRQFLFASQESFHSLVPVNMETQFTAWCWACRRAQAGIRMLVIHTNAAFFLLSHLTHTHGPPPVWCCSQPKSKPCVGAILCWPELDAPSSSVGTVWKQPVCPSLFFHFFLLGNQDALSRSLSLSALICFPELSLFCTHLSVCPSALPSLKLFLSVSLLAPRLPKIKKNKKLSHLSLPLHHQLGMKTALH